MDKKIANNTIVGIFVSLGFIAFLFFVFSMGGSSGFFSSNYSLFGRFSQVKGLHTGSEIALSGLRIGVVKEISVSTDGTKELIVELSISKKMRDQIKADSIAVIKTQGMLGDKYIELSIGSRDAADLKPGSFIVTKEDADLFSKSGNLVEGISKQLEKGGNVEMLLINLAKVSDNLAIITTDIRRNRSLLNEMIYGKSGEALNKSVSHLEGILKKIDAGEGTIGALINDPTVYEDLRSLMGGAKRSSILKYFMRQFIDDGTSAPPADQKKK